MASRLFERHFHESPHRYLTTCPLERAHAHTHTQPWRPTPKCLFSTQPGQTPGEVCDVIHRNWGNTLQLVQPAFLNEEHHTLQWKKCSQTYDLMTAEKKVLVYLTVNLSVYLRTDLSPYQ